MIKNMLFYMIIMMVWIFVKKIGKIQLILFKILKVGI